MSDIEVLYDLFRVVEYHGGAVYATELVEESVWATEQEVANAPSDVRYVPKSTSYVGTTIRLRKD